MNICTFYQECKTWINHNLSQIICIPTPLEKPVTNQALLILKHKMFLAITAHHEYDSEEEEEEGEEEVFVGGPEGLGGGLSAAEQVGAVAKKRPKDRD